MYNNHHGILDCNDSEYEDSECMGQNFSHESDKYLSTEMSGKYKGLFLGDIIDRFYHLSNEHINTSLQFKIQKLKSSQCPEQIHYIT